LLTVLGVPEAVSEDVSLVELGMDSLRCMQVVAELARNSVPVTVAQLLDCVSLKDLFDLVETQRDRQDGSRPLLRSQPCYSPVRPHSTEQIWLGDSCSTVITWLSASASKKTIVLLHGGADTALSFQALVDNLPPHMEVYAPVLAAEHFLDNLRTLHRVLLWCSPSQPAVLVGHSLGGALAAMYAGLEPSRVSLLVSLEGLRFKDPVDASPHALKAWVGAAVGHSDVRFSSFTALQHHIALKHPRVPLEYQAFLALHCWGRQTVDGEVRLAVNAVSAISTQPSYEEFRSCVQCVRCPAVLILGELSTDQQQSLFPTTVTVTGVGHCLQLEAPREVARIVDRQVALQHWKRRTRSQSVI